MYMYMYIYIERPSTLVSNDWFHASNPFVKLANAHASDILKGCVVFFALCLLVVPTLLVKSVFLLVNFPWSVRTSPRRPLIGGRVRQAEIVVNGGTGEG